MTDLVIELCAGAGLASLGWSRAGFRTYGVELDADACASHVVNVGPCERADISTWSPWLRARIVAGGVPCTSFSMAGKRGGLTESRGRLYEHLLRIASEAGAEVCLLENSDGLCSWRDESGETAQSIIERAFRIAGYEPVSRVLRASDYGTPQHRYRLFIVGFRDGATRAAFRWPSGSHAEPGNLFGLPAWVTVRTALGLGEGRFKTGLKECAKGWQGMRQLDVDVPSPTLSASANADLLTQIDRAGVADRPATTILGDPRLAPAGHHASLFVSAKDVLDEPSHTVSAGGTGSGGGVEVFANENYRKRLDRSMYEVGVGMAADGRASHGSMAVELDEPSRTITSTRAPDPIASPSKPKAIRLSLEQCANLQGLPPGLTFYGNKSSQHMQVGNGCPPQFTEALGKAIQAAFDVVDASGAA